MPFPPPGDLPNPRIEFTSPVSSALQKDFLSAEPPGKPYLCMLLLLLLSRLPCPWDSPGKNTGVGCHFLLQCMKVKNESEVALCPTLSNPIDCSLPDSSVHGICQARVLDWVAIAFSNTYVYLFTIYVCKLLIDTIYICNTICKYNNNKRCRMIAIIY